MSEQPPISIANIANHLITAIKPAAPTATTLSLIEGNARYWTQNTMIILRDHYQDDIQNAVQIPIQLEAWDWRQNFDIASAWAKSQFGRRLREDTLEKVQTQLRERLIAPSRTQRVSESRIEEQRPVMSTQTLPEGDFPSPLPERRSKLLTVTAEVHPPPPSLNLRELSEPLLAPATVARPRMMDCGTMTAPTSDWSPERLQGPGRVEGACSPPFPFPSPGSPVPPFVSLPILYSPTIPLTQAPKPQRKVRRLESPTSVIHNAPLTGGADTPTRAAAEWQSCDDESEDETTRRAGPFVPPTTGARVNQGTSSSSDSSSEEDQPLEDKDSDSPIPPTPPPMEPAAQGTPALNKPTGDLFETERDNIHWTQNTARRMLDHWLTCLNKLSP
ncbi:proline-rich protein 36-like [Esox lucius]|uniref:proline-rich protein 36-like n=1 Tax=Esox lucius TaxID=8010 RepID=UPI00147749FA|nr:proline-rich protein 36-like [Esox lucius]